MGPYSPASRYASQHFPSRLPSPEILRVVAGRAPDIKILWGVVAWLTLALVCVAAAGLLLVVQ